MTTVQQVGGEHYQAEYQHWDWVIDANIPYLEANATKYLSRWWKKAGPIDIEKSLSYVEKILEALGQRRYSNASFHISPYTQERQAAEVAFQKFVQAAKIPPNERGIIHAIGSWKTDTDLVLIKREINTLYMDACAGATGQAPLAGGGTTTAQSKAPSGLAEGRVEHPAPFGYDGQG
jgi:hypothetical protein